MQPRGCAPGAGTVIKLFPSLWGKELLLIRRSPASHSLSLSLTAHQWGGLPDMGEQSTLSYLKP